MKIDKVLLCFVFLLIFSACAKDAITKSALKEKSLDLQVLEIYQDGKKSFPS